MHRHGYSGSKLGRERDQRRQLIRGLSTSLIEYESIETTLPKAKQVVPYTEKLITKAKKGTLHSSRQVFSALDTKDAAHKLIDEIAPKLKSRNSGYFRIEKTRYRRGDNAQMAAVSFVDDLDKSAEPKKAEKKVEPSKTSPDKKEKVADDKKSESKKPEAKTSAKSSTKKEDKK